MYTWRGNEQDKVMYNKFNILDITYFGNYTRNR